MGNKTVLPFGPQHPVLPEPLHLRLVMQDEKIVEAIPAIGYVHRGLEKLTEAKEFSQNVFVVERICGICSIMHAQSYCQCIESIMDIKVPERAEFLRVIWGELHRLHSHFLWLGLFADAFGYESLFMQCWRIREKVLDLLEKTTGHRIIVSINTIGGVRRDMTNQELKMLDDELKDMLDDFAKIEHVFIKDYTIAHRTVGVGVITKEQAIELGCVGPVARGSNVKQDMRTLGYAAYGKLDFEPVLANDGDCFARLLVRLMEVYQSIDLIRQAIAKIPGGDVITPFKGFPDGEHLTRVEQPRGEVIYFLRGDGTKNLTRMRVRTPTFANIPALITMLPGSQLADVPVLALTIDPCISCTER